MKRRIFWAVTMFLPLFTGTAYADGMPGWDGWFWHYNMMGGGIVMWIFWIFIIGAVVYFFVNNSRQQQSGERETPLNILQKRYARGDISQEEYEEMKRNLER